MSESRIERICHDKGLKMTEQRRVIARVLSEASDHPDVEEVHRRAHTLDPRISIATVYRTVRLFEEANIIERHDFRNSRARYEEVSEGHHHHHLINVKTGEVIEFESEALEKLKRKICRDLGFDMVGERLELYGVPLDAVKRPRR
jgi:Fur family transcriptional regulator, ferric uptake regulator